MESNILINIEKEMNIHDKVVISNEYFSNLFIYTRVSEMELLFRKDTEKLYRICNTYKTLSAVENDQQQIHQMQQIKSMISSIDLNEKSEGDCKEYYYTGKGDNIVITSSISTHSKPELEQTINYLSYQKSKDSALVDIELSKDEIIYSSRLKINIQGTQIETKTDITKYQIINNNINQFDYLLNYKII